jgi:hypothetical protein
MGLQALWVSSQAGHDGTNTWDPNLVRLVMAQATQHQQVDINRINFIDAAQWLAAAHDEEPLPVLVINLHHPYHYKPRVRVDRKSKSHFALAGAGTPAPPVGRHGALDTMRED